MVKTTNFQHELLARLGFVHVTGLTEVDSKGQTSLIGKMMNTSWIGHWNSLNGLTVLFTSGGEVWLRGSSRGFSETEILELCPNGRSDVYVPSSENGSSMRSYDIFQRLADPYWDPEYQY